MLGASRKDVRDRNTSAQLPGYGSHHNTMDIERLGRTQVVALRAGPVEGTCWHSLYAIADAVGFHNVLLLLCWICINIELISG